MKNQIQYECLQVSKWKLYKTARKRGIYAEIKKQNQAHVSPDFIYLSLKNLFLLQNPSI